MTSRRSEMDRMNRILLQYPAFAVLTNDVADRELHVALAKPVEHVGIGHSPQR